MSDDKRLDRLLEYTKFHLGIYLSAATGMVGFLAVAADKDRFLVALQTLFAAPWALAVAAVLMAVAGMAGGIIASSCTQCQTFSQVWDELQGPHKAKWLKGQHWALVEHGSFWLSFGFLAYSMLSAPAVLHWLRCGAGS